MSQVIDTPCSCGCHCRCHYQQIHCKVQIGGLHLLCLLMHPDGRIPVTKSERCRSIGSQLDKIRMNLPRQESSRAGIPIRSWGQIKETKSRIWRKCGAISAVTWSRHIFSCFLAARPLTHVLDRFSGPRLRRFNFGLPGGGWGTFQDLSWMHQFIHLLSKRAEYIAFYGHKQKANNMIDYLLKHTSSIPVD